MLAKFVAVVAAVAVGVFGTVGVADAQVKLRFSVGANESETDGMSVGLRAFRDYINYKSGGELQMEIFWNTFGGSVQVTEQVKNGTLDIALITRTDMDGTAEIVRREPLLWVSSAAHDTHLERIVPLALGRPSCKWRERAVNALAAMNREHRIIFNSWSATVIAAAVLSGQAVSVLPECALRPGMRVLGEGDGFKPLGDAGIGILRGRTSNPVLVDALARHIAESLDNLTVPSTLAAGPYDIPGESAGARTARLRLPQAGGW